MNEISRNHRFDVGNVHIVALSDGQVSISRKLLFPDTPEAIWDKYKDRFPGSFNENGFLINLGVFLIKSSTRTILVDTGLGPHSTWPTLWPNSEGARKGPAELMDDMKAKGIGVEEIDAVFLTHLHGDHVGWNLTKDADRWNPTFPKAQYLVHRSDWEAFTNPKFLDPVRREAAERNYLPLQELGVLQLIEDNYEVAVGLTAIHSPGHTPGHMSMLI